MSDDNEKDLPEEETSAMDADALANEVAAGVADAGDDEEALADEWAAAMEEAGELDGDDGADAASDIRQVELDELHDDSKPTGDNGIGPELDVILDIPVRISMEVGATQIPIRNLLQLNQGSVVELDRLAGEPLDVMVNGTLIAHGEVVMVNDKFGIRLTDVVSQSERIQRLR
ncbi:flagellar motor switch protein FliN [Thalassolituus hydrocarboniclasticus]|jgi:flagellar motor switch protein FliN/FliY|uniref:Flagellar motor switch protein FliN n=1 Tax=Thalassolituus hydrocarboniclasticus TaxID=2742796 RepID=A0ABY6AED5_9GAMM|nr:flagellar motor switch protein FliN [Thalassolituus hydrocarboniclasticus]UXD88225.1 flagellar motor switch protein FliN [Thalassolituus hydrocarboniclasticus]